MSSAVRALLVRHQRSDVMVNWLREAEVLLELVARDIGIPVELAKLVYLFGSELQGYLPIMS